MADNKTIMDADDFVADSKPDELFPTLKEMETLKSDGDIIAWKKVNEHVVYTIVNKKDIITSKGLTIILTLKASDYKIIKCYGTSVIQRELTEATKGL